MKTSVVVNNKAVSILARLESFSGGFSVAELIDDNDVEFLREAP